MVDAAVSRRARVSQALVPLVWAVALVGASHWPAACALLPALGVLRGPLGPALVVVLLAISAFAGRQATWSPPEPHRGVLFVLAFGLLAGFGLHYSSGLRVSGDEPHYLIMAQSLWREGDLDLRDNHTRQDYREYTPGVVAPHYGAPRADGRPFPAHSVGLPLLLAPLYDAGGRAACVLFLALLAAWMTVEVHTLARRLTHDSWAALVAWGAALGSPAFAYAFHVYTEIPSALLVAIGLRVTLGPASTAAAVVAALAASALPWLHLKLGPCAVALGVLALLRFRGRALAAFVAIAVCAAAAFLAYYHSVFGVASPLAIYGGIPRDLTGSPLRAVAGLLLDRSFGLLPHAPVFLLAAAGAAVLARRAGADRLGHALVGLAIVLPILQWRMWWGGQCPPARFLVPLVPTLAVAIACVVERRRGLGRWAGALLAMGLALVLHAARDPGALLLLNRGDRPTRLWGSLSGDAPLERYLPSLVSADPAELRVAVVWAVAVVAVLALHVLACRRDTVDRWFRGVSLPLVLLLTIGAAVDGWARAYSGGERNPAPTSGAGQVTSGSAARRLPTCAPKWPPAPDAS